MARTTALFEAVRSDRIRTVKRLVEKHNVDIHARSIDGITALDIAEANGRTECAAVIRELMSTRPPPS